MKIAVIGTGKTGGKVFNLLGDQAVAFNTRNEPLPGKLKTCDAAIIFVPGDSAMSVYENVLESGIPAVWGTTGFDWPADLDKKLKDKNLRWVIGSNFSMGMNLVRKAIGLFSEQASLLNSPEYHIHEVHHVHKKDAPSGTALSWREWLGKEAEITSERKGDIKGIHELEISTDTERIVLRHEALDRALFAEGAIWAAKQLLDDEKNPAPGLHSFADLFDNAAKLVD